MMKNSGHQPTRRKSLGIPPCGGSNVTPQHRMSEVLAGYREHILLEAIRAMCHRCAAGEKRDNFRENDRTHKTHPMKMGDVTIFGHFSCPANRIWELLGK